MQDWLGKQQGYQFKTALFPASTCIKLSGRFGQTSQTAYHLFWSELS